MNDNIDTPMVEQFAQPEIITKKSFSPIWILPIVALLIGLGLIAKSILDSGVMITLQIPSADGIEVGKTRIFYKGIPTGVVKKRTVTEDLQNVILHIEMDKKTKPFLNENTVFWIVEPRISLSGVSGLDTLVGGRYISLDTLEEGEAKRDFIALDVPPPPSTDTPGLHLKLRLNRLASIDRGTVIYYKQIPVGKVTNYTLEENDSEIHAWMLIEPKYAHLVKEDSRFYNVSGIRVKAGLSGIDVQTESLISMFAGGIAFYNPHTKKASKAAQNNADYLLHSDFETAQVGIPIVLRFKNTDSIQENNTDIKFQGKKIGRIGDFNYDKKTNEVIVLASIDPSMEDVLTENTQFWIVKPSVKLLNMTGLDALFSGNYIQLRPTLSGKKHSEFIVKESKPVLADEVAGLHFYIESTVLGSISKESPIYYKNIEVGYIEDFELTENDKKVRLRAFIKPEFSHLVKNTTRFYNVSGLNIKGGLSGIKVEVASLVSLLKGGISFYTPDYVPNKSNFNNSSNSNADKEKADALTQNNHTFKLYNSFDDAKAGISISLIFNSASGLSEGSTKVIYKGIVLGVIKKITVNKGKESATATVVLDPIAENSLVADTKFWVVKPKIGLTEVKNIDTLINGEYITLRPGVSKKKKKEFTVMQYKPALSYTHSGLHLKIKSHQLGAISIGSPIMYNQIKIGDVQDYELSENRNDINILIHIWPQYADIINNQSRFYNASGIHVEAGLSGVKIQTGSIDSILKGGISVFNPKSGKKKIAHNGDEFKLFKNYNAAKINAFYIRVQFNKPNGLSVANKVQYRGINIGNVHDISLNKSNPNTIWVTLELDSAVKNVLGSLSQFWIVAAKVGLAKTENIDTLITGSYIKLSPVSGRKTDFFIGLENSPLLLSSKNGFTVNLNATRLSSLKVGDPVYYRQVKVGSVIGYELSDTADQILVHLNIRNRFKPLIRENSKFWHTSGIDMDISLFGTSKIRMESIESLLSGGISFATPDNEKMGRSLPSGSFFVLYDKPQEQWLKWNPIIQLAEEREQGD